MDDTLELQIPHKLHKLLTEMARREGKTLENFVSEIISGQMKKMRCICDSKSLVTQGCTCGAFQAEQEFFALIRSLNGKIHLQV
jgi:hypothetical protein